MKEEKQRTLKQNSSIHLYLTNLAEELNLAGLDMRKTLKPTINIPWTMNTAKEYLYKPVVKLVTGKDSTTQLTTKEIDLVFDTINRHLGEQFGLHVEFPSIDTIINKSLIKE